MPEVLELWAAEFSCSAQMWEGSRDALHTPDTALILAVTVGEIDCI